MLKDDTEKDQTPYFMYTNIPADNLLVYMDWHSWTCELKNNNQNMQ